MAESPSHIPTDHLGAIATLADELKVPVQEVGAIFESQFDRLAAQARITNFLVVLAMQNTRSILREGNRRASLR